MFIKKDNLLKGIYMIEILGKDKYIGKLLIE